MNIIIIIVVINIITYFIQLFEFRNQEYKIISKFNIDNNKYYIIVNLTNKVVVYELNCNSNISSKI